MLAPASCFDFVCQGTCAVRGVVVATVYPGLRPSGSHAGRPRTYDSPNRRIVIADATTLIRSAFRTVGAVKRSVTV